MIFVLLLFIGVFLIFLEFYTPGGILAVAGGFFWIIAVIGYTSKADSAFDAVAFSFVAILLLIFVVWFALQRIKKSAKDNTFYLQQDQEGFQASEFNESLIGKMGQTVSDLGPSGFVVVEGKRYQAIARSGYIDKGNAITVIGGQGAHLLVKLV